MFKNAKVLFVGAHPDDIELSCLGTILKYQEIYKIKVYVLVCSNGCKNKSFKRVYEQKKVSSLYNAEEVLIGEFEDGNMLHNMHLVTFIEEFIDTIKPDYIFSHTDEDFHQDHIAVSKSVISAIRKKNINLILYPSITFTSKRVNSFSANLFVDVSEKLNKKLEILKFFKSQTDKFYFDKSYITEKMHITTFDLDIKYYESFKIVELYK